MFRDMRRTHGEIAFPGRRLGVSLLGLIVGAGAQQGFVIGRAQRDLAVRQRRDSVGAGDEHVRQSFVAMHVEAEIDAGLPHAGTGQENFRAFLHRRFRPFPIQVGAGRVCTQIAAPRAVWIHVRHDVQHGPVEHGAGNRIGLVDQPAEKTFHPPGRLAFARMLPPDRPADPLTVARRTDGQQVQIGAIHGLSQHLVTDPRRGKATGEEIPATLAGIGREIGVVGRAAVRRVADREDAVRIIGRHPEPVLPVVRRDGPIVLPTSLVACFPGIFDAEPTFPAPHAGGAKMEPLEEIGIRILADRQSDRRRIAGVDDFDIAGIEMGADMHCFRSRKGQCPDREIQRIEFRVNQYTNY